MVIAWDAKEDCGEPIPVDSITGFDSLQYNIQYRVTVFETYKFKKYSLLKMLKAPANAAACTYMRLAHATKLYSRACVTSSNTCKFL